MIEDNPADVFLIKEAIRNHGLDADITIVDNGEAALDLVARMNRDVSIPCPDLLLLDINLPRTDGFTVLEKLRSGQRCAQMPVVVMTSSAAAKDRNRSTELGANAYFQKPSTYDEYLKIGGVIEDLLKKRA